MSGSNTDSADVGNRVQKTADCDDMLKLYDGGYPPPMLVSLHEGGGCLHGTWPGQQEGGGQDGDVILNGEVGAGFDELGGHGIGVTLEPIPNYALH